jgi:hypothetical protein
LRLAEHETSLCHCGCGQTIEVSRNPDQKFVVHEDMDYARAAIEKVRDAKRKEATKDGKERDGWDDGLTLFVQAVTEEEAVKMQAENATTIARRRVAGG